MNQDKVEMIYVRRFCKGRHRFPSGWSAHEEYIRVHCVLRAQRWGRTYCNALASHGCLKWAEAWFEWTWTCQEQYFTARLESPHYLSKTCEIDRDLSQLHALRDRRSPGCPPGEWLTELEIKLVKELHHLQIIGSCTFCDFWISNRAVAFPNISEIQWKTVWDALYRGRNPISAVWPKSGSGNGKKPKSKSIALLAMAQTITNYATPKT